MTRRLTAERLKTIASWRAKYGAGHNVMIPAEEAEALAAECLANRAAQPVAWRCLTGSLANQHVITVRREMADDWERRGRKVIPLATPPAPAVLTDEQIDAVLDSRGNMAYVIADKRERLRMFAREILRTAMLAHPVSQGCTLNAPAILEGWKLVPVEPTEEMLAAAERDHGLRSTAEGIYWSMLAAAPEAMTK